VIAPSRIEVYPATRDRSEPEIQIRWEGYRSDQEVATRRPTDVGIPANAELTPARRPYTVLRDDTPRVPAWALARSKITFEVVAHADGALLQLFSGAAANPS
jgi:hypothetical protein